MNHCCKKFAFALASGTDNEGYSALVRWSLIPENPLEPRSGETWYNVGCDSLVIDYCPFCGAKLGQK
jgi:hypothetical protein